jgi:apolipoprotein N-acyltransferase
MDNFQALKKNKTPFVKNKIIMIDKEGKVAWEYLKTRLVPGIETPITIPGDGNFRSFKTPHGVLTGAICYEMDFPEYIRKARHTDAVIMLAPSNDWKEIKNLHAFIATIRAIENGFSLVRPTSGGISLATDPYGRIIGKVDYFISRGSPLVVELPVGKVTTIYSFIGDIFGGLCLIVSIVLVVFSFIKWKRESR